MTDGRGQVAAGAVAAQHDVSPVGGPCPLERRNGIRERRGMEMFGCKTVVDGNHVVADAVAKLGANIVMTVESAKDEAAAVKIEDHRRSVGD